MSTEDSTTASGSGSEEEEEEDEDDPYDYDMEDPDVAIATEDTREWVFDSLQSHSTFNPPMIEPKLCLHTTKLGLIKLEYFFNVHLFTAGV